MSRRRAPSTAARPRCTMISRHSEAMITATMTGCPPTLGLVLAGGLARRMGGGDKARIRIGRPPSCERVLGRLAPQCSRTHPQRQRRSGAFCRYRPAGRRRQRAGFCRTARRHPGRPRLGGGERAGRGMARQRAGRLPVPAERSGGAAARGARRGRPAARLRALRRMAPSGGRACGRWRCARICAARWSTKTCARSRCGPRGTASPSPNGRPSRSIRSSTSTRRRMRHAPKSLPALSASLTELASLFAPGGRQPRKRGATRRFEALDLVEIRQRHVDIVDAANEPILAQFTDVEPMRRPVRRDQRSDWADRWSRRARPRAQLAPQLVQLRHRSASRRECRSECSSPGIFRRSSARSAPAGRNPSPRKPHPRATSRSRNRYRSRESSHRDRRIVEHKIRARLALSSKRRS